MTGSRRIATAGAALLAAAAALSPATRVAHATPDSPSPMGTFYGDPAAAARFWRYQQDDDDCVEMAVADVVGEVTGHQPSERAIVHVAQSTPSTVHPGPMYSKPKKRRPGSGTSFDDEPKLLAQYGIHAVSSEKSSLAALERNLARGRKVIAAVNAELIWGEPVEDWTPDGKPESNHAVVVTGVDTATGTVHLNDSGIENGGDERIPIDLFARSWASGDDQMTVTG